MLLPPCLAQPHRQAADAALLRLLDSASVSDQLGGLALLLELARVDGDGHDGTSKSTNFANHLRRPLASNDAAVASVLKHCFARGSTRVIQRTLREGIARL